MPRAEHLVLFGSLFIAGVFAVPPQFNIEANLESSVEFEEGEKIPMLIHQVWGEREIQNVMKPYVASWQEKNPLWKYRMWRLNEVEQLVDTHYTWFSRAFRALPLDSHRISISKFFILDHVGGMVADASLECVKPVSDLIASVEMNHGSVMIGLNSADSTYQTDLLASVPGHKLWTSIVSRLFDSNWQAIGDENILQVLVTKTIQEYLNRLNGKDIYVETASKMFENDSGEMRPSNSTVIAVRHFASIHAPEHHDFSNVSPGQLVQMTTRLLISTADPMSSRGIDFIVDHWQQVREPLSRVSADTNDVQLLAFAKVSENSFALDFSVTLRYSFSESFSRILIDLVNSRSFEHMVSRNGFEIRDTVVLFGPAISGFVRSDSSISIPTSRIISSLVQSKVDSEAAVGPFDSSSKECQGDGDTVSCCCETFDSENVRYTGCRLAAFWAVDGKCPFGFPYSIPSAAYANQPPEPLTCTGNTTVESLIGICELSRCTHGVVETCDCLQKYVNQCLMVGEGAPFPEPCALTREAARNLMTAKQCGNETVVCHKPLYLDGTQFIDDCGDTTAVDGTCNMICAEGYTATENSSSTNLGLLCSTEGWKVVSGNLECEEILNCSTSFLEHAEGLVHDCEEGAPIRSHCVMSCEPGYTSSSKEDRVVSFCKTVSPKVANYNQTITCTPTFCSTSVIPKGLNHNCSDHASIHSTCVLTCPNGQLGDPRIATCVGHGGKADVGAWAEYDFEDLSCTNFDEIPELASLVVYSHSETGEIPLQISPDFFANVTKYALKLPSRISQIRLSMAPSKSWTSISEVVCSGCEGKGTVDGVLVLGTSLHEITIKVAFSKDPFTSNEYKLYISRLPSNDSEVVLEASSVIKLDTQFTPDWIEKNGDSFTQVVAGVMNISKSDVMIKMVLPGSVIIDFVVRVAHLETNAAAFEKALVDGTFSDKLCKASQVCATQLTLVAPMQPTQEKIEWPAPTPTPLPAGCSSQEALSCANYFINRACRTTTVTTDSNGLGGGIPPHCAKHSSCLHHVKSDDCRFPVREINGCHHQASEAELLCEYNFVEKDCDESRRTVSCKPSGCHNATIEQVCPFILGCTSPDAKACVDAYVSSGCNGYIVASGCHRHLECQIKAKNSINSVCPPTPLSPVSCSSVEASICIQQFIAGGCERAITTPECVPYLPCQKAVKRGHDVEHRCPVPSTPAHLPLTPQQLLWLHMLMLYRFQMMLGMAFPNQGFGGPALL